MAAVVISLLDHRALLTARARYAERVRQRERAELALRQALENEAEAEVALEALKTPPAEPAASNSEPGSVPA